MATPVSAARSRGSSSGGGSAPERVYQWLRQQILTAQVPEGAFLDEVWVAESVGTSRTPVREAFHRLNAERFIDLLPRKGAQVRVVSARELEEVNATRHLIESHAAMSICAAGQGAPPVMYTLLDEMKQAEREQDWVQSVELNSDFHRAIVFAHGNAVLTELYDGLRSRQLRVALRALRSKTERVALIDAQHLGIVEALAANDGSAANRLITEHLRVAPEVAAALGR